MDSRRLMHTFQYSESILQLVRACGGIKQVAKGSWQRANPKIWSLFQSELFTWILMMVVRYFYPLHNCAGHTEHVRQFHQQESSDKSWSLIFYEYMFNGEVSQQNILPPRLVKEYYELLTNTMDCLPPDLRETAEVCITFWYFFMYLMTTLGAM